MTDLEKAVDHLRKQLAAVRTDRPSPSILDNVKVVAYGQEATLRSLAQVTVDGRSLVVSVFDPSMAGAVDKAIRVSGLGFNPNMNGATLIIPVPPLNEERRKQYQALVRDIGEEARIAIRSLRKKMIDKNNGETNDVFKGRKNKIDDQIKTVIDQINAMVKTKEAEVMNG